MQANWHDIEGWFTDADAVAYQRIADALPDQGGRVVELGAWLGRSTACLISLCLEHKKQAHIIVVDTFQGTPTAPASGMMELVASMDGSVYPAFMLNMQRFAYPLLTTLISKSAPMAKPFPNKSIDAVFIDADHSYEACRADIKAWLPKIKAGGIMAGHDYDYNTVIAAVGDTLGSKVETHGRCWLVRL